MSFQNLEYVSISKFCGSTVRVHLDDKEFGTDRVHLSFRNSADKIDTVTHLLAILLSDMTREDIAALIAQLLPKV